MSMENGNVNMAASTVGRRSSTLASTGSSSGLFHQGGRRLPASEKRTAVTSKRITTKLLGPPASNASITVERMPVMSAASATTTDTPTATPRIVRLERSALARIASNAMSKPSLQRSQKRGALRRGLFTHSEARRQG